MNTNWAYGFALDHEGAGVGMIYYAARYFDREGIINPACAEAYTSEEIASIKNGANDGSGNYIFDVPENALIGMNVIHSDKIFWYDGENSAKIISSAAPLGLDKDTGAMLDQDGAVVAEAIG
ncbi:MAG: hypothetical protein IKH76_10395 [Clostridiales bacterium]|nr:hypothetical protein [Clostridiales bacterium]